MSDLSFGPINYLAGLIGAVTKLQILSTEKNYLSILKVLIEELLSASGIQNAANLASQAQEFADEEGDDDGWEDVPSVLDLGLGTTKADLMAYGEGQGSFMRQKDDETQSYMTEFFVTAGRENVGNFNDFYNLLTDDEKGKLQELAQGA